jgi:hypothetical protein
MPAVVGLVADMPISVKPDYRPSSGREAIGDRLFQSKY